MIYNKDAKIDISYGDMDEKIIPLVELFNKIGLKTEFSCEGHPGYGRHIASVTFDESVKDEDIIELIELTKGIALYGRFYKWYRPVAELTKSGFTGKFIVESNWVYRSDISTFYTDNQDRMIKDTKILTELVDKYINKKED